MDSIEEERLYKMRQDKNANKTSTHKKKTGVKWDMAVILFSTNVSHLIHLSIFSTVSMLNNRFSTHLTTWLLCWELGRGATARAQSIGKIAISGAFYLVWLYNVFHSICNISKVILWSLGEKKPTISWGKDSSHTVAGKNWFFTWLWWGSNTHWSRCG